MAIYRLSAQVIRRSSGRSAVACAAYRAGDSIEDARQGILHDYSRRGGVHHSEILAPEGTPDWMLDRSRLWNGVEAAEKRRDSQLAREIQLALPHELTDAERIGLVRSFVAAEFVSQGMIADVAIHRPDTAGDNRNHHAHIMLTMRALTADGFGQKCRDWNDVDMLRGWRAAWADHVNAELERAGLEDRIDHRSFVDRGIDLEPEPKLGPVATELERHGQTTQRGDDRRAVWERNAERTELQSQAEQIDAEIIDLAEARDQQREPLEIRQLRRQHGHEKRQLIDEQQQRRQAFADDRSASQARELQAIADEIQARHRRDDAIRRGDDKTGLARLVHRAGRALVRLRDMVTPKQAADRRRAEKLAAAALARSRAAEQKRARDAALERQQAADRQARRELRQREGTERRLLAEAQARQIERALDRGHDLESDYDR